MIGLDCKIFEQLLFHFKEVYREINPCSLEEKLTVQAPESFQICNKQISRDANIALTYLTSNGFLVFCSSRKMYYP